MESGKRVENSSERLWSRESLAAGNAAGSVLFKVTPVLFAVLLLALLGISLNVVYSATIAEAGDKVFRMQLVWVSAGLVSCVIAAFLPLRWLYRKALIWIAVVALPLFYLALAKVACMGDNDDMLRFFPFVREIKGAMRWLCFEFGALTIQIQPSEFAKLALIIFVAGYYGHLRRRDIKNFVSGVLTPCAVIALILGLVILGKDLSTTMITGATCLAMMFLAGVKLRYFFMIILLGVSLVAVAICSSPMRLNRMTAYLEPEKNKDREAYQLYRSQLCLGVGGSTGAGYSKGYMKSYLPESKTDFIVAVIGEEFGFAGVFAIIVIYLLLCGCIVVIAQQCRERRDLLLCLGVAVLIAVQALVNIGVVSGWCPPTGVTAPFLSYGGSSMVSLMFLIGLVLNVCQHNYRTIYNELINQRCVPAISET